jgi:hypothetical protein
VIRNTISEWAPTSLSSLPGWLTVGSALAVAWILIVRRKPVPWTALVTLAGTFLLAMSAQRAIVWWGLVAPVVLAGILSGDPTEEDRATRTPKPESRGPARMVVATLVLAVILLLPWFRGSSVQIFLTAAPPGLTGAVQRLPAGSRLMVHQPWGSWFEFAVPNDFVFVDSRIEIIPEDVWKDYGQVGFAGADWREVLDSQQVDAIVAEKDWPLLDDLENDPAWRSIYEDADGELFVRAEA